MWLLISERRGRERQNEIGHKRLTLERREREKWKKIRQQWEGKREEKQNGGDGK